MNERTWLEEYNEWQDRLEQMRDAEEVWQRNNTLGEE